MSLLRRIACLLLLAVWVTASQHCGLEAAGLWDTHDEESHTSCCVSEDPCAHDACDLVERSPFTGGSGALKVPLPQVPLCTCLLCLLPQLPELDEAECGHAWSSQGDSALAWVPTWHFARRAAPSPRAPDLSVV